jgi:ABC-type nitrate/sulfonate/bicarbonate transport system substrate-binding protein
MMPRRPFLVVWLAVFMLLPAGLSPVGRAASPVDSVRVLFQPFAFNGPLFIAEKERYFARQGISVTWVPLTAQDQAIPLLAQGQLDVGFGLTPAFFNAVARGALLRFVADRGHVAGRGNLAAFFVRNDLAGVVQSIADLKARKIGLPGSYGNLAHFMLDRALRQAGLRVDQVSPIFLPPTAVLAALQSGAVDAALLSNPIDAAARERGIGVELIDVADIIPGEHTGLLIFGRTLLGETRSLGVRVMVAYLQGVGVYALGPTPRNVATIAEYTKTDPEIIRKSGWVPIYPDGHIDVNRARRYQDWLYEVGLISVRNPISTLIDLDFVEQARARLGLQVR